MLLLSEAFEIKDLGDLHYFLGLQITRTTKGLFLHQAKYAHDLLVKHNTLTSKPAKTPCTPHLRLVPDEGSLLADPNPYHRLVGSFHYLTLLISTLLCIRFVNSCLNPLMFTWLLQSVYSGILMAQWPMVSSFNLVLCHFQPFLTQIGLVILMIDSPLRAIWSIWGTTLLLGVPRNSWLSLGLPQNLNIELLPLLLQNFVGFINYWRDLGIFLSNPRKLWCDNDFALAIASNSMFHARTKHIEVDYHFIRDWFLPRDLQVKYVTIDDQLVDVFIKGLPTTHFLFLRAKIMLAISPMILRGDERERSQRSLPSGHTVNMVQTWAQRLLNGNISNGFVVHLMTNGIIWLSSTMSFYIRLSFMLRSTRRRYMLSSSALFSDLQDCQASMVVLLMCFDDPDIFCNKLDIYWICKES